MCSSLILRENTKNILNKKIFLETIWNKNVINIENTCKSKSICKSYSEKRNEKVLKRTSYLLPLLSLNNKIVQPKTVIHKSRTQIINKITKFIYLNQFINLLLEKKEPKIKK